MQNCSLFSVFIIFKIQNVILQNLGFRHTSAKKEQKRRLKWSQVDEIWTVGGLHIQLTCTKILWGCAIGKCAKSALNHFFFRIFYFSLHFGYFYNYLYFGISILKLRAANFFTQTWWYPEWISFKNRSRKEKMRLQQVKEVMMSWWLQLFFEVFLFFFWRYHFSLNSNEPTRVSSAWKVTI